MEIQDTLNLYKYEHSVFNKSVILLVYQRYIAKKQRLRKKWPTVISVCLFNSYTSGLKGVAISTEDTCLADMNVHVPTVVPNITSGYL